MDPSQDLTFSTSTWGPHQQPHEPSLPPQQQFAQQPQQQFAQQPQQQFVQQPQQQFAQQFTQPHFLDSHGRVVMHPPQDHMPHLFHPPPPPHHYPTTHPLHPSPSPASLPPTWCPQSAPVLHSPAPFFSPTTGTACPRALLPAHAASFGLSSFPGGIERLVQRATTTALDGRTPSSSLPSSAPPPSAPPASPAVPSAPPSSHPPPPPRFTPADLAQPPPSSGPFPLRPPSDPTPSQAHSVHSAAVAQKLATGETPVPTWLGVNPLVPPAQYPLFLCLPPLTGQLLAAAIAAGKIPAGGFTPAWLHSLSGSLSPDSLVSIASALLEGRLPWKVASDPSTLTSIFSPPPLRAQETPPSLA
ncbi:hypothetical protein CYMTET_31135 [Cymbomonas tetramitiformis]|uniref:Uncharacterized protein n=1 Tax=Cymbomonas tetramitiformis TaxID=36881 RepID=A0AAE0FIX0_9CHLO|nr:hypothetical protein CYMTET_31135 [Cymbomonas tetramitiformis]